MNDWPYWLAVFAACVLLIAALVVERREARRERELRRLYRGQP